MATWVFANNPCGSYGESDWDTGTIIRKSKYYFKESERNRTYVKAGDRILLREYGRGFWAHCEVSGDWIPDLEWHKQSDKETGWFPISGLKKWGTVVHYELIKSELSNQNHRLRIARATDEDWRTIDLARKLYDRLGYGATDGEFFILEAGLEEAVKKNLKQLGLRLADNAIQQQCNLGLGIGRTDLICLDTDDNFVVLELKAVNASDVVIGQILRYMGYVRENFARKAGKEVSGIILTPSYDEQLRLAAAEAKVKVLRVRM